jgi:RNase P/RNase MRP subunit p30
MSKPILFLCSSHLSFKIESLYYLKNHGRLLNLQEKDINERDIQNFTQYQFIICNAKDEEQYKKLRFIPKELVYTVIVLRSSESVNEDWVKRTDSQAIIKDISFFKECKTIDEIRNFIQHLASFKKPDNDIKFYGKKIMGFLFSCLRASV